MKLRAAFFMQDLSATHAAGIRGRGEVVLPAGQGRTAFVDVGALRYFRRAGRGGVQMGRAPVTTALYAVCRSGMAAGLTGDVRTVTGRAPADVATYVHDERTARQRPAVSTA